MSSESTPFYVAIGAYRPTFLGAGGRQEPAWNSYPDGALLILDEIQKIPDWSESVKRLWDEDTRGRVPVRVVLLGSSPLLDAGNTTTLARYLELLACAGLLVGLQKCSGSGIRRRASSPKLQVLNNALLAVHSGRRPEEMASEPGFRGRLLESAVGAHLVNGASAGRFEVFYWRDRSVEVDFVVRRGAGLTAIEVKSGRQRGARSGLGAFCKSQGEARKLLVGGDGIELADFLARPAGHYLA